LKIFTHVIIEVHRYSYSGHSTFMYVH